MIVRTLAGRLGALLRVPWLVTLLLVSAVSGIWAFTTPLFGAPDEPAHIIRAAAIVRGEVTGATREGEPDFVRYVSVPAIFESVNVPYAGEPNYNTVCFAFDRNVTPDCLSFSGSKDSTLVATAVARFPPLYYILTGAASLGLASVGGVLLMRGLTVFLCAVLLAFAVGSMHRAPGGRATALGLTVAVTPMVFFVFGSVNPSALEIAAAITLWAAGSMLVVEAPARIDRPLVAVTGVAGSLLVLSRSLSPLWLALIALTLIVFAPAGAIRKLIHDRTCQLWAAVTGAAAVAQLAWIVVVRPLDLVTREATDEGASAAVRQSLGKSGWTYEQMIGSFGWLDTPAPFLTVLLWTTVLGGLLVLAVMAGTRRQSVAVLGLAAAVVLVPVTLETANASNVGFAWQGRHTLPLAVGVPILAGLILASDERDRAFFDRSRLYLLSGVALFVAHILAYAQQLRRNMVGYDGPIQFWRDPAWSPLLPAWLLVPGYALVLAGLLLWLLRSPAIRPRPLEART